MPLRHRHEYAAAFPRGLLDSSCLPPPEFPTRTSERVRTASSPDPPGSSWRLIKGGVTRRFLAYSSPTRSPDPNHLAVLTRPGFVRAAPTLPGTTRGTAALSSAVLLRQDQRRRSLTSTRTSEVDPGRTVGVTAGGFPRAASRTRRARHRATGSPQAPWALDSPYAPAVHGAGMRAPR